MLINNERLEIIQNRFIHQILGPGSLIIMFIFVCLTLMYKLSSLPFERKKSFQKCSEKINIYLGIESQYYWKLCGQRKTKKAFFFLNVEDAFTRIVDCINLLLLDNFLEKTSILYFPCCFIFYLSGLALNLTHDRSSGSD